MHSMQMKFLAICVIYVLATEHCISMCSINGLQGTREYNGRTNG
jgi:sulfite exporter TauE/SafE